VQNKGVSYFEECLTFGDRLFQDERRALYKYLLETNKEFYKSQANSLLNSKKCTRAIANGEIIYLVKENYVSYSARKLNSDDISADIRQIRITKIRSHNIRKLCKFFAQSDVDIIRNFPLPSKNSQEDSGFGITVYPYYSLAYYADGKNYLLGLIKKLRTNDKETLVKLRTL
jgi:hypothetical protein